MTDRHEHRRQQLTAMTPDSRSAMTRAGDGLAPRFYDPSRGREEPAAVTAARERHRAINAGIERAREMAAQRERERGEARAAPQEAGDGDEH